MAKAHLIHGFVGVGNTTFVKKIEESTCAMRLSPDEWMITLYGRNPPADLYRQYEERIMTLIWSFALNLLRHDIDVILDFGFWRRADRDAARQHVQGVGAEVILYFVTCSEELILERVLGRTREEGEAALHIDENAILLFKSRFEPLGADEDHTTVETSFSTRD